MVLFSHNLVIQRDNSLNYKNLYFIKEMCYKGDNDG